MDNLFPWAATATCRGFRKYTLALQLCLLNSFNLAVYVLVVALIIKAVF